jgi:hypothetical protein
MNYLKYEKQSIEKKRSYTKFVKQATLFNQAKEPKQKTTIPVRKKIQLSFIQRVVKSLFKL